jgi:hypothetical protein
VYRGRDESGTAQRSTTHQKPNSSGCQLSVLRQPTRPDGAQGPTVPRVEPRQRPSPPFFTWASDALELIRFAYQPIKRMQIVFRVSITGLGLTISVVLGWFGGVAWFLAALLAVVAILFLIGGARLMHSDVDLADVEVHGSEMRLDVLNLGRRTGTFTAKVVDVTPRLQLAQWLIKWELVDCKTVSFSLG